MGKLPEEITTAVLLAPLMKRLDKAGVMPLPEGSVRVSPEVFHNAFSTWIEDRLGGGFVYHIHKVNGVKVYCLFFEKEVEPDDPNPAAEIDYDNY